MGPHAGETAYEKPVVMAIAETMEAASKMADKAENTNKIKRQVEDLKGQLRTAQVRTRSSGAEPSP